VKRQVVCGDRFVEVDLPDDTTIVSPGFALPLEPAPDLGAAVQDALDHPLDTPPLSAQVNSQSKVTLAFDDATVPCYAPLWSTAIPLILDTLARAGVRDENLKLICANALHRKETHEELAKLIGGDVVAAHADRLSCHDAEDADNIVSLGKSRSGYHVEMNKAVIDSDLIIYLNASTTRGFSGGWKSVCVGLSTYRSIHHHHTPDIMSMSLDRNQMHQMLDEMGEVVEAELGRDRIFKLETVLANPVAVHRVYGGTVGAARKAALDTLRSHQSARRDLVEEKADVVVYGVPEWSPYAAFSHMNPILDLISTGLGYLGGMIEAVGKKGCTVVMATPCRDRWNDKHHASYREVWERVLPETHDPDDARARFEPELAGREDYIDKYRNHHSFHPVHPVMALYPLKRLRHAANVIVAGAEDPSIPAHCGFQSAPMIEGALALAKEQQGPDATVALVENPLAFNRQ
jgi:lactate racemase